MANTISHLERTQRVQLPLEQVFEFFSDAANLQHLTPPFLRFRILSQTPLEMAAGTRIDYMLSLFLLPIRWRTHITEWQVGVRFVDEQERGPFAIWRHTHRFEQHAGYVEIHDLVEYAEPFGVLGWLAHRLFVRRLVNRIFDYRQQAIERLLATTRHTLDLTPASRP